MDGLLNQLQDVAYNANRRQRSMPKQDTRCRWQVRFWLDVGKDVEYAIAEQIAQLKESRMFTQTVRDALALVFSLQKRRVDLLESLFPFIREHYRSEFATAGQGDMNARLAALEAQIAALKVPAGQGASSQPGPRAMSTPPIPGPVADEDDAPLVVRKATSDGKTSAMNFLAATERLQ